MINLFLSYYLHLMLQFVSECCHSFNFQNYNICFIMIKQCFLLGLITKITLSWIACPPSLFLCQKCINTSTCFQCIDGSFLNFNGTCDYCGTQNCRSCPYNSCKECQKGYKFIKGQCNEKDTGYIYVIAGTLSGAIIATAIIICCCCCNRRMRMRTHESAEQRRNKIKLKNQDSMFEAIIVNQIWKEDQDYKQKGQEQCSFCLEKQINLQLKCHHLFHLTCISMWLSKHKDCPLCKQIVQGQVKQYCIQCFHYSTQFSAQLIQQYERTGKKICLRCKQESTMLQNRLSNTQLF